MQGSTNIKRFIYQTQIRIIQNLAQIFLLHRIINLDSQEVPVHAKYMVQLEVQTHPFLIAALDGSSELRSLAAFR